MMHALPFRLPHVKRPVFRVLCSVAVLLAFIANGLVMLPGMSPAQAQTQPIAVSPAKRDFTDLRTRDYFPPFEFTVEADGTLNSLDLSFGGSNWVRDYELIVNGRKLAPKINDSKQAPFKVTHSGLNMSVKKGDKIQVTPTFNESRVTGSVSVALWGTPSGSTPPPTTPPPGTPDPSVKTVTPAAPTAVDPATAPQCVEKGYINIPGTQGVDYFIDGQKKPTGQQFYEGRTAATFKVTAKAQSGYQIASGVQSEWSFKMSGQVKTCSGGQPTLPDGTTREFKATGHGFALQADPVDPTRPDAFTAKVGEDSQLNYITVRIKTDATFLDWQYYHLTVDKIEDGVTLEKRNVNIGNGYITMDVVPMKNGKQVDSAFIPQDAVFTFTNNLSKNKKLSVELDAYGVKATKPKPPEETSPPDGADWVNKRATNPQLPARCGLRVGLVVDLSTSLKYADPNGFTASKRAANAFIDALAGTPAELGIYNFATTAAPNQAGTTRGQNPPYISMQSPADVSRAKQVVSNWSYNANNSATNWEAGLKQVQGQNYDVVYFITDGMPTTSSTIQRKGISGEFVQASALNDAINAANELKRAGTRVVPLMVDLTLGGDTGPYWVVKQDLVLKDIKRVNLFADETQLPPGTYFKIRSDIKKAREANYIGTGEDALTLVNLERAIAKAPNEAVQVFERPASGGVRYITGDQSKWTYGPRAVKTMGEDISGTGDTIRVQGYGQLTDKLKVIAQDLTKKCNGEVIVKKRIVDESGNVLSDGEPGWEFTLSANGQKVIDPGNGEIVYQWRKATSWRDEDKGTARWNIQSETSQELTLTETQQAGYTLFKRDSKNAVCYETRDGQTTPIAVQNEGEFGFKVRINEKDKVLSRVSCVVDNYKTPEATGKLTFKKAQYVDGKITEIPGLGGATFEIYPAKDGKPDYSAGKPLYTIKPGQESIEVKTTGTFFLVETKAPNGLNLLPKPVPFEIAFDNETNTYKVSTVGESSAQIVASGSGDTMLLRVADTSSGKLPKTGGNGVMVWALAGLMMAGGGALWMRRRKS